MVLQRVRSLATTRFETDAEANEFTPAFDETPLNFANAR